MSSVGASVALPEVPKADRSIGIDSRLSKAFLVGFVVLFFYTPTAQIPQSRVIVTALVALMLLALAAPRLNRATIAVVMLSVATCTEILLSAVVNLGPRQALAHVIFASFKPFYFALMFTFGYVCVSSSALKMDGVALRRLFTVIASLFICSQLMVALLQALGAAGFLNILYSQEKTRDLTSIMRATGTFGNPNSLAFFTLQCFLFILLLGTGRWYWKGIVLLFGAALIALAGSRSVLIVLMMCLAIFVFFRRKSISAWIVYLSIALLVVVALALLVQAYAEYFRYLSQLQLLLTTDSPLTKVNSMAARLTHWDASLALFDDQSGVWKYLFGLGDRAEYSVLDNDYLYIALRHGAFGIMLFYGIYVLLATQYFEKSLDPAIRFFGLLMFFAAIVVSFAGEFFSDWHHMVFFIVLTGALTAARSPFDWIGQSMTPRH